MVDFNAILDFIPSSSIKGVSDNSAAAVGFVGEYIVSTVAPGSAVALINGVGVDITSIALSGGQWVVSANLTFLHDAATAFTRIACCHSPTSGAFGISTSSNVINFNPGLVTGAGYNNRIDTPTTTYNVSSAGTVIYLVALGDFTLGNASAAGSINATRVR